MLLSPDGTGTPAPRRCPVILDGPRQDLSLVRIRESQARPVLQALSARPLRGKRRWRCHRGRSDRGVKTRGLYGIVRHPMYAAHMIAYLGYTLSYPSSRNILVAAAVVVALNMRAVFEERLLERDPLYRTYLRGTHWRFLPYVY